jgi:putative transposase
MTPPGDDMPKYLYRKLTPEWQAELLRYRRLRGYPLHAPPHLEQAEGWFLITASTYEHRARFITEDDRGRLLDELFTELQAVEIPCRGWVVLPNHYHLLVQCRPFSVISQPLRRVHGRTAVELNRRLSLVGQQVWYRFSDRQIRSERHYYTTLNYIHFNPVKHGYVEKPLDWPCASVHWYMEHFGVEWLRKVWREYPVRDYGKGWDWGT